MPSKALRYEEGIWDTPEAQECFEIIAKLASYTNPVTALEVVGDAGDGLHGAALGEDGAGRVRVQEGNELLGGVQVGSAGDQRREGRQRSDARQHHGVIRPNRISITSGKNSVP